MDRSFLESLSVEEMHFIVESTSRLRDSMCDPSINSTSKKPDRRLSYGITHVAEVSFSTPTSDKDLKSIESNLFRALSLMRSRWVGVIGPWIRDANGVRWNTWPTVTKSSLNGNSPSWCHDTIRDVFEILLPAMHSASAEEARAEALQTAIHWYVESQLCAGGVEGSIVLQQAALESLGWV